MEKQYTISKTGLRADCGSDHELLTAKLRPKIKNESGADFLNEGNQEPTVAQIMNSLLSNSDLN